MNRTNKILIAVLVAQLALVFVMRGRDAEPGLQPMVALVQNLAAADATHVAIYDAHRRGESAPTAPTVDLVKAGAAWQLASGFGYPVDSDKVDNLIAQLTALQARGAVATGPERATQLAVADDTWERKIVITTSSGEQTFYVGSGAGNRRSAFRVGGSDKIFATTLSAGTIGTLANEWIDPVYTTVPSSDVVSMTIARGGTSTVLDRRAGDWTATDGNNVVTPPAGKVLDTALFDRLVASLAALRMTAPGDPARVPSPDATTVTIGFKVPAPVTSPPGADGIAPPSAVESIGPPTPRTFTIDLDGDSYWIKEAGNPRAALVSKATLADLAGLDGTKLVTDEPPPAPPPTTDDDSFNLPPGMELPPGFTMPPQ